MHKKSTKNCRSFVSEHGEGEQQPLPAATVGSDADRALWRGYWRTTKITMKWKMHCKCRKTEPVYPFASFITGNWRLNVQKKQHKTNPGECECVCMHVHNEAVPNGRCKRRRRRSKARRNGGVSVHLSLLRRVGRAPLLPTLIFYTSSFVVVSCTALSHTDAWLYVYVCTVYNTYERR